MRKYFAEAIGVPGGALRCKVFGLRVFETRNADRLLGCYPVAGYAFYYFATLDDDSVVVNAKDAERPGDVLSRLGAFRCAIVCVQEDVVFCLDRWSRPDALVKVSLVACLCVPASEGEAFCSATYRRRT